jgi:hypothetical protein
MKKMMLLLLTLLLIISLLLGCGKDRSLEMNAKETKTIVSIDELDEIPNGTLGFSDFLFIDDTTTIKDIIDRNGSPDAMYGSHMNTTMWYYKLADGGLFSFVQSLHGDISSISYEGVTIILEAPTDYLENAYNDYQGTNRVVYLKDVE